MGNAQGQHGGMADCVDDDTEQAVITTWNSIGKLATMFKQSPRTGRQKSTQPGADIQATGPYAIVDSQLARREVVAADAKGSFGWNDYRHVTLTLYGVRADVTKAVPMVLGAFNRLLGVLNGAPLVYPSGARFMRWWPQGDAVLEEDKDTKAGKDIWKATIKAEVWSVRQT